MEESCHEVLEELGAEDEPLLRLAKRLETIAREDDYFIERNGLRYAGSHLILDLWDAEHLDDAEVIEMAKGWPRTGGERGPEIAAAATKLTIGRLSSG